MNYGQDQQRNAIAQAMMNVQNPPPRIMTAQMTPQGTMPLPTAQRPQMLGDDAMPQRPPGPPVPGQAPPAPGAPMNIVPPVAQPPMQANMQGQGGMPLTSGLAAQNAGMPPQMPMDMPSGIDPAPPLPGY